MVHDAADVPAGPGNLDSVRVAFDEERLISDAGLLVTATLAERLGIEELVNESVWLDPRLPGASLPGRKVMSLVHGMLAGADRIDQMNVLRAGSTSLILGHRVMAPSTLGTFLRAFTFGHVRQLDRVLDVALARAWAAGAGPGDGPLVIDVDSFIGEVCSDRKQGASYGYTRKLGYHPILAVRSDTGEVLHIRNRKGEANTQRGFRRFVEELIARVRRAGHTGPIIIRADSGFENRKLMRAARPPGRRVLDRHQADQAGPGADRPDPRDRLGHDHRLPGDRGSADRRNTTRRLPADRAPHPARRRPSGAVPRLATSRVRDQPHRAAADRRYRSPRPRADRARDPRSQRPSALPFPVRADGRQQRLDRDRRARAQPRTLEHHDRSPDPARADRPRPPPATAPDPRPPDPHQPPMDTPTPRPLAMADRLHHRARHDPRAPRPHLTAPAGPHDKHQHTPPPPGARSPCPKPGAKTLPRRLPRRSRPERRHPDQHQTPERAPSHRVTPPNPAKPGHPPSESVTSG